MTVKSNVSFSCTEMKIWRKSENISLLTNNVGKTDWLEIDLTNDVILEIMYTKSFEQLKNAVKAI